jgi:hypothetical protein
MTPLQRAMTGNAVFSSLNALVFLGFGEVIAASTNVAQIVLEVIAVGLLGFAALLAYGAFGAHTRLIGRWAVSLDWAWVVGSVFALALPLSALGRIGIVVIATLVAGFAVLQQRGLTLSRSR